MKKMPSTTHATLLVNGKPHEPMDAIDYASATAQPMTALERLDAYGLRDRDASALAMMAELLSSKQELLGRVLVERIPGASRADVERVLAALTWFEGSPTLTKIEGRSE